MSLSSHLFRRSSASTDDQTPLGGVRGAEAAEAASLSSCNRNQAQTKTRLTRPLRTSRGAGFDLFDLPRFFAEGTGISRSVRATFVEQAQLF